MPGETALAKVSKYDFFAILGSGSYVVGCYWLLIAAWLARNQNLSTREALKWLSGTIERHWPVAVASLFLAFLIGNVLRAVSVTIVDNWCNKWWNKRFSGLFEPKEETPEKTEYYRALRQGSFPYLDMLEMDLKVLKENVPDLDFSLPRKGTLHSMFHFWKAELCHESGAAFEYAQELEGRVRLFATMFWAALLGLIAGVLGLLLSAISLLGHGWIIVILFMLGLSALICFIFGPQLRRVRGQEVRGVFNAYVSLTLKRSREKSSS